MEKLTDFFAMGGYGPYIWPSFALALALIGAMTWASLSALRKAQATLSRLQDSGEA